MRTNLALYALDRPELVALSGELKQLLTDDDRPGLARLLGLGPSLAERLAMRERAVDWFLLPEAHADAAPLFASLRRVAKTRALELAWTSAEPSLEGRLRHYDVLRDDADVAKLVDQLLDPHRLPWFLTRPGATGGWLDDAKRSRLASELGALTDALPPELRAFAEAIDGMEGDVVAHDML